MRYGGFSLLITCPPGTASRESAATAYTVMGLTTGGLRDTFDVRGTGFGDLVTVTNSTVTIGVPVVYSGMALLAISTGGGADTIVVDTAPAGVVATPIELDGGNGSDTLRVTGTAAAGVDELIYSVGPTVNSGRLRYEDAVNTVLMSIDFTNLEPVQDNLPAATVTVNGTNGANAISYTAGPGGAFFGADLTGLVGVDGFETYEFSQKGALVINALGGSDTNVLAADMATLRRLFSSFMSKSETCTSSTASYTTSASVRRHSSTCRATGQ